MSPRELHEITTLVSRAAAALIPTAAGGRDADGRLVVDRAGAIQEARRCLREALRRLDADAGGAS
ncbi:MAG: hypothetical protein PWQ61_3523 [Betaproteobacteria bacterium]|nr:hypothetical protein [Betaproteobacteria bacterium]